MSKRQTSHRKSRTSVGAVKESSDRQSTRRSSRVSGNHRNKSLSESPKPSANCPPTPSPNRHQSDPSLSQYFPSRKRSQSSPKSQTTLPLKYTRIKSPNGRFVKNLLAEDLVVYGNDSFEDNPNQPLSSAEVDIESKSESPTQRTAIDPKSVNYNHVLTSFETLMDEIITEDVEQTVDDGSDCPPKRTVVMDDDCNYLSNAIPKPCHSLTAELNNTFVYKEMTKTDFKDQLNEELDMRSAVKSCELNANKDNKTSDCLQQKWDFEDNLDDSLDQLLTQMVFPIEEKEPVVNEDQLRGNGDEEDDGFESDDSFERMVTQMSNEELIQQMKANNRSDSALESTDLNSSSASNTGFLTLSQIIELINRDE